MKIQTTRFGEVEIQESEILTMPNGMLGFTNDRHFALLEDETGSRFQWMQSLDNPDLAFVTIDPDFAISDYRIEVSADHLKKLDTERLEDVQVRVIVTMTRELKDVTINLQGPLLFNFDKKQGMQMVITDGRYNTRHLLFGDKLEVPVATQTEQQKPARKKRVAAA